VKCRPSFTAVWLLLVTAVGRAAAQTPVTDDVRRSPASLFEPPVPGGLTADRVAKRAVSTSREAAAAAEEAVGASAQVQQAQAAFLPRLMGGARYTRLSSIDQPTLGTVLEVPPGTPAPLPPGTPLTPVPLTFPVFLNQFVAEASLQVPLSDDLVRLPWLSAAAAKNARAATLLERATRMRVATEARVAYYAWARARLQAEVAVRGLDQARAHLEDVTGAQATGAASKADVLRVAAQVAGAELLLIRTRSGAATLEQRLRTLMHDGPSGDYQIGEDLRDDLPPAAALALPEQILVNEALEHRPEMSALAERAGAAQAQAGAARAAGWPRLDAVGNAAYARPNGRIFPPVDRFQGSWDASLQISWAPTDLFGTEAGRRAAAAHASSIEAQRGALADGIQLEVVQALRELRDAEAARRSSERGLAAAEESYRVRRALFQNGRATSVELTDAETERSRAELEAVGTRIDRRIAEARLIHALGREAIGP
jgi:outer membrane protein TolC